MSRAIYFVFTSISICLWGATAFSAEVANSTAAIAKVPVCVNGNLDKNQKLIDSFEQSGDPLVQAFRSSKKAHHPDIKVCGITDPAKEDQSFLATMVSTLGLITEKKDLITQVIHYDPPPPSTFERECMIEAMRRHPGRDGYVCAPAKAKEGKPASLKQTVQTKYGTATEGTGQCINNQYVDYMKFAVDSAYDCISPKENPLDARSLFKKFNAETGFNTTVAWDGGVGAAQLTTTAIEELTDKEAGGNCTEILHEIANSDKKSCEPFKEIARKDSKSSPKIDSKNYCTFVSVGDGLARNLMLGTAYNRCLRDRYIVPMLRELNVSSLAKNKDVVSALTSVGYGKGGINQAKVLIKRFRAKNGSNPGAFLNSLVKASPYLRQNNAKIKEMYCLKKNIEPSSKACEKLKLSAEEESGDLCVTQ